MKKTNQLKVILILLVILAIGCRKSTIDYGSGDIPYNPNKTDSVRFSTSIIPIFTNNCTGCHGAGSQDPCLEANVAYDIIINGGYVIPNNPTGSFLYTKITETPNNHSGGAFPQQGETIRQWILQGAKNN
jgi:hypothetical protein